MNSHDELRKVLDALRDELTGKGSDESIIEMAVATFHTRRWWLTVITWTLSLLWFIVAIVCAVNFFGAGGTHAQIAWAAGFLFSMQAVAAVKIWAWMDILHTSSMRELKRVEAAVVRLAEAVGEK